MGELGDIKAGAVQHNAAVRTWKYAADLHTLERVAVHQIIFFVECLFHDVSRSWVRGTALRSCEEH